jgi:hypothetical protein
MTTKPDPPTVMAVLKVLESKLSNALEEAKADPTNLMQDFYVVALTAVANFLEKSDVKNEIAHKFIELASFIQEGSLPFLRSPKAGGRTYDSQAFWVHRAYPVVGLECILRSGKMNLRDAAKYIAKKYPVFNRLSVTRRIPSQHPSSHGDGTTTKEGATSTYVRKWPSIMSPGLLMKCSNMPKHSCKRPPKS